ncbi:unnamed protein product [Pedinophyceae sp. YPF-701]|nr:unnamed protein product [Pedinophyceae sp. YPF-701]
MPPKKGKKGKKKTPAQLEEERRKAEEEARRLEEERLRLEEEERLRLEEEERKRQELIAAQHAAEDARITEELASLEDFFREVKRERAAASERREKQRAWEHARSCTHLPLASSRAELNTHEAHALSHEPKNVDEMLALAGDHEVLITDLENQRQLCLQEFDLARAEEAAQYMHRFHDHLSSILDRAAAYVLWRADELTVDQEEKTISVAHTHDEIRFGMWCNLTKNPRIKAITWPSIGVNLEVPKQITLQMLGMRCIHVPTDHHFSACTNKYMALGGVLGIDLVALHAPAKNLAGWTIRTVTPAMTSTTKLPYPSASSTADGAEPPNTTVTWALPEGTVVDENLPAVGGVWDFEQKCWRTDWVKSASVDREARTVTLTVVASGPMALLQERTRVLPFDRWHLRPTGGRGSNTAALTVYAKGLAEPIEFGIGEGSAWVAGPEDLPAIKPLLGVRTTPRQLLLLLSRAGLHLLPEERDAEFVEGVEIKDPEVERAMCEDLALLCGAFIVGSSRWNKVAGKDRCMARASEIVDWEGEGRTERKDADRVLSKEKMDRPTRPLCLMRRGAKGVCFVDALDKAVEFQKWEPPQPEPEPDPAGEVPPGTANTAATGSAAGQEDELPPVVEMPDWCRDEIAHDVVPYGNEQLYDSPYGEVHACALALLRGITTERVLDVEGNAEVCERLKASPDALDLAMRTSPLLTQAAAQLMLALRLFSFG